MYRLLIIFCLLTFVQCEKSFSEKKARQKHFNKIIQVIRNDFSETRNVRKDKSGKIPNVFSILNFYSKNNTDFKLFIKPDLDRVNVSKSINSVNKSLEKRYQQVDNASNATNAKQFQYDPILESRSIKEVPTGRKKKKKPGLFEKVLPMFVIPYLVQSAILPMLLMSLKFMLMKSFLIGKLAIFLMVLNAFRRRNEGNDNMTNLAVQHYGYTGGEEYGAYVHK